MATITNPILPGFNPDPSICRRGDDYYIATSTFEWFPGVQIHHSRDLVHWRLLTRPLDRLSQLNLIGDPDSGGIWAPCLTWADDRFWLIYTDVKTLNSAFKDTLNYLVTAPDIMGPWSEPIYLNASGFDPSLFHDDDGRKWLANMRWDHRAGRNRFAGIELQEFDPRGGRLVGPIRTIAKGTALGCTEGPHLYKRRGRYYLMMAEGGTGYGHAVTVMRADRLEGPYEVDPLNPMLTARDDHDWPLQKAGHASLVETPAGEAYLVHLCSRPLATHQHRRCMLGRETAIQRVRWTDDGWLRLADGGRHPQLTVPAPPLPPHPFAPEPERDEFDGPGLGLPFQSLRRPVDAGWADLTARPGWLRLRGGESLHSRHRQSLIARRVQHFHCEAETLLDFAPQDFQQMAGLIAIYDARVWHYLQVTRDEERGRLLLPVSSLDGDYREMRDAAVVLPETGPVALRVTIARRDLRFAYRIGRGDWQPVGSVLDATVLSDEYGNGLHFTGAFVGLCCQDLSGRAQPADFDSFAYRGRP